MKKSFILAIVFVALSFSNAIGQNKRKTNVLLQHEVGANVGLSNFQSDFHPKGPLDGLITINGFTFNATHSVHILPKSYRGNFVTKRLMLKSNLGFTSGRFNNYAKANGDEPFGAVKTDNDILLAKVTSKTSVISLHTQMEFYFKDLIYYLHKPKQSRYRYRRARRKRRRNSRTNPYVALGIGLNYVNSSPSYDQKAIDLKLYPDNYDAKETIKGINKLVFSSNLSVGVRYKIDRNFDLTAELKATYYLSDRVDGVNPDLKDVNTVASVKAKGERNDDQFNDYNNTISLGLIYHLF